MDKYEMNIKVVNLLYLFSEIRTRALFPCLQVSASY